MLLLNLIVGLGIFLYGMSLLEKSIEKLSGAWVKTRLSRNERRPINSVLTGTVITALVQSSSMVSLLVLAFSSAGIIHLFNAVGVLLGANLGTTFTGWIVATVGFKVDLSSIALPCVGIGGFIQVISGSQSRLKNYGSMLFAFGLLLFGLGLMKEAVSDVPDSIDIEVLKNLNAIGFLGLGVVLTAVIQSSSATMMIALAALNAGIINLPSAAALIIGADLGTTSTTVLGSITGSTIKRQLALAHVIFNFVVDMLAFVFLLPVLPILVTRFGFSDPLYSLVAFHSMFNLFGLCLFLPFIRQYTSWLERFFRKSEQKSRLEEVPTLVPEAAISACEKHTLNLLMSTIVINLRNLRIDSKRLVINDQLKSDYVQLTNYLEGRPFERRYEHLKQQEGDLLRYASTLQQEPLNKAESEALNLLLNSARNAVYATKTLKDIRSNLVDLRHAIEPDLQSFYEQCVDVLEPFYQQLIDLLSEHDDSYSREKILQLFKTNEQLHQLLHESMRNKSAFRRVEPERLSTLLNVNRELWHCGRNLLVAIQQWNDYKQVLLDPLPETVE